MNLAPERVAALVLFGSAILLLVMFFYALTRREAEAKQKWHPKQARQIVSAVLRGKDKSKIFRTQQSLGVAPGTDAVAVDSVKVRQGLKALHREGVLSDDDLTNLGIAFGLDNKGG